MVLFVTVNYIYFTILHLASLFSCEACVNKTNPVQPLNNSFFGWIWSGDSATFVSSYNDLSNWG